LASLHVGLCGAKSVEVGVGGGVIALHLGANLSDDFLDPHHQLSARRPLV
jgi:hypothetical protein